MLIQIVNYKFPPFTRGVALYTHTHESNDIADFAQLGYAHFSVVIYMTSVELLLHIVQWFLLCHQSNSGSEETIETPCSVSDDGVCPAVS